jgi:CRISPR-associated protein (TIGR03984 family)
MTGASLGRFIPQAPEACAIETLDRTACDSLVQAIADGKSDPAPGARWLLAHCDDGVIWGASQTDGRWRLSGDAFPEDSPRLVRGRIQQLRVFGNEYELLLWRTESGLHGRRIMDIASTSGFAVETRPANETIVLVGDRAIGPSRGGFTKVGDATGSSHVVPLELDEGDFTSGRGDQYWPLRLDVRHFFAYDGQSGAVRVAATRLLDLWKEKPHVASDQSGN